MSLLNYTTTIAVEKTLGEVQVLLRQHKVRGIQMRYDANGEVASLTFSLETAFGEHAYALPVNVDGVEQTLTTEKNAGRLNGLPWRVIESKAALRAQASRVAWRILKEWLEAQLAIIQCQVVSLEQVLLPFQIANEAGETVYEVYERQQLALPKPGATTP